MCVLGLVLLSSVCFGRAAECILLCMSFFLSRPNAMLFLSHGI